MYLLYQLMLKVWGGGEEREWVSGRIVTVEEDIP